jgi:hemerythrin-like domain-containing protein
LGNLPARTTAEKRHHRKHDKILHATLIFTRTKKTVTYETLAKKDFAKQTRTQILENLTLIKNDKANETEIILQTQLTRTFAKRNRTNFESLQNQPRKKTKPRNKANQNQR